ncbi:MAG TPA: hypothetical protein VGN52_11050, partial [Burkholderiales bacterium]|jgi:hypothetical protein
MAATDDIWVIESAKAIPDAHGLLHLHLKVMKHPHLDSAQAQTHVYRVDPDTAGEVIDVLLRVAEDANPGATEA